LKTFLKSVPRTFAADVGRWAGRNDSPAPASTFKEVAIRKGRHR
jgi:hypothetical protein